MQNTHDEFPGADDEKQHTDTQTHNSNSSTNSKDNNDTAAQDLRLHPLQLEDQPQPWLIPHPNFPISWRDDGQTQSIQNDTHSQEYQVGSQASYPSTSSKPSTVLCIQDSDGDSSTQRSTSRDGASSRSHLQEYDWRLQQQQQQLQQLRQYRNSASDQGHESDPSELLRPPVLFGNPYPVNLLQAQEYSQQDHEGLYPVRRSHRSMSLSIAPNNVWRDNSSARALSSSHTSSDHHEVVPYTQEWRVILRSPPRGRTVLYNPQMQSLVVQSTVGLDSHPMSLREDSAVCALCRRPLDLNETVDEQFDEKGESYMDTNYFRMLADANTALSRRGSLQGDSETPLRSRSPIGVPTSSSRTTLDLDSQPQGHSASSQLSHDALNQGYYERFFVEQKKLGKGYRGSVFLCQHVLDGIHLGEYAIKKVAVGDNHDWLVQMLREVHLLERLHHPNIVSYKHAWLENHQLHKFGPEVTCLFILMECANGGNLEEYIEHPPIDLSSMNADPESVGGEAPSRETESQTPATAKGRALQAKRQRLQSSLNLASGKNGRGIGANGSNSRDTDATSQRHYLSVTEIWSFFFDICEGLAHLHRLGIIHRDLKPPNLLLSYSNSRIKGTKGERPRVLITDFGECEILEQAAKRDRTGATGTLEFLAPELLDVDADGKYTDEFSFKGDMWSLGMVLYYLCYSRLPYSQIDDVDLLRQEIRQVTSIPIPEDDGPGGRVLPDELKFLIRMLLSPEKLKRPSCDEILSKLSQQRDRMMHGDMESTPIPVHVSTNIEEEKDGLQEADNITDEGSSTKNAAATASVGATRSSSSLLTPPTRLSTKTTTAKARGSNSGSRSPHLHPQNYPVIGRRASRPMLVTERVKATTSGSNANHHHSSSSLSSPYPTRSSASPSVNLHKKIKPLGLGIRYMLRRKMMHHLAANPGGGQESQRYSKNNDGGGYSGSSTSPLPLTLVRPKSTSVTSSVDMEQNSKSLVRSSPLRMNMLPPPRPPPAEQYQHQPPPPLKRQQDEDMKDVSRPHNPPSSGARPSDGLDPSHDVSSSS
ncbi:putative serine/threonine-protein kinase iks1 [Mortierella sp. GBA43]|nr:putative serine/threonine-protein kinase iks1 [Mortierella sp. GBA43]